jgi:hypothetical protein
VQINRKGPSITGPLSVDLRRRRPRPSTKWARAAQAVCLLLADEQKRGAEEGVEGGAGGGVTGDGGFDGFLGGGAVVAEVEEGGEDVVGGGGGGMGGGEGSGGGEVVEFFFELDGEALGEAFADAGDAGESGVVLRADGGDGLVAREAAEDGEGEARADAGDSDELLEEAFFRQIKEAIEEQGVFADLGIDVQASFLPGGG